MRRTGFDPNCFGYGLHVAARTLHSGTYKHKRTTHEHEWSTLSKITLIGVACGAPVGEWMLQVPRAFEGQRMLDMHSRQKRVGV